jgi:hypothetical protein
VKKPAPTGWPHWAASDIGSRAGERAAADRQGLPVRRRGRAVWLGRVGPTGLLFLFLFLWIF